MLDFDHKGTNLNSVIPVPLSRKSFAFLFPLEEGTGHWSNMVDMLHDAVTLEYIQKGLIPSSRVAISVQEYKRTVINS